MSYSIDADLSSAESPIVTGQTGGGSTAFDGQTWNHLIENYSGDTYMTLSSTGWTAGDTVELKFDKDDDEDDEDEQDVDTVFIDLSQFSGSAAGVDYDANFQLDVKSMMTADNLYLSNVLSVAEVDSHGNLNGNIWTDPGSDTNAGEFGEQTLTLDEHQQYYEVTYLDANGDTQTIFLTYGGGGATTSDLMIDYVCFTKGTLITTQDGERPVEDIKPGDKVLTRDNGFQTVRWAANRTLEPRELLRNPHLRPYQVRAHAFGENTPVCDTSLSPQHRVLQRGATCEMLFGSSEVLVPVKALANDHSIVKDPTLEPVTYCHFMFDTHQIVYANGLEAESYHPGEMGVSVVGDAARAELFELFPHLENDLDAFGPTVRPTLKVFEGRMLSDTV